MTVGERIKQVRENKSISQEDLAKKLGLKDNSSVCKIEKAGDNITTKSISKYAEALGVTPASLMGWEPDNFDDYINKYHLNDYIQNDEDCEFVGLYQEAAPEIRQAVLTLLKSSKHDS